MYFNPIPTSNGLNQPIYSYHVTQAGRNRVKSVNKGQWCVFIGAANSINLSILVWLYCSLYRGVVPPPYLETWPTTIHVVWKRSLLFRKRVHGGQCVTRWSPKMDGLLRRLNPSLAPIGRCSMKELWFAFRSSIRILKLLGILENEN